jgi:hypothetical protein
VLAAAYFSDDRTESKKWDDTGCSLQRYVALHVVTVVESPDLAQAV